MKVLVTGGAGFIGSHVVDKLRDKNIDVRVYDMIMPTYRKDIEFYQASLLDFDALCMALNGVDAIFHLAAIADVKDVYENPHYSESINVRGTINVLEAARRNKAIKRVIYASTTWVYSDCTEKVVNETTPLPPPTHLYTTTKLASEYYCSAYSKLYDLGITILRYGIPYGPRMRGAAVLPIFVRKALAGEPITIAGDGSQFRKFVYVEDLAEGNVLALKAIARNKVYNLSGDNKITIKEIADTVQKVLGTPIKIENIPTRAGDFQGTDVSNKLAKEELQWQPKVSFEEGVRKYIEWYKEQQKEKEDTWKNIDEKLREAL